MFFNPTDKAKVMKAILIDAIIEKALLIGDKPVYRLKNGTYSRVYINCKKITYDAYLMQLIGELILNDIQSLKPQAIGGLTLGASPIACAVSYTSVFSGSPINVFVVREKTKDHGVATSITGCVEPLQPVVIVEDVVTTGGSTIKAIEEAERFGLVIKKVITLVDREEGGKENIETKTNHILHSITNKSELLARKNLVSELDKH